MSYFERPTETWLDIMTAFGKNGRSKRYLTHVVRALGVLGVVVNFTIGSLFAFLELMHWVLCVIVVTSEPRKLSARLPYPMNGIYPFVERVLVRSKNLALKFGFRFSTPITLICDIRFISDIRTAIRYLTAYCTPEYPHPHLPPILQASSHTETDHTIQDQPNTNEMLKQPPPLIITDTSVESSELGDLLAQSAWDLLQAKEALVGRNIPSLELPINGLLGVVDAIAENPYDTAHSRGVSIALMAFRDRVHAAAASHSQLLKRILARAQQPILFPANFDEHSIDAIGHAQTVVSIRLATLVYKIQGISELPMIAINGSSIALTLCIGLLVQEFLGLEDLSFHDIAAIWGDYVTRLEQDVGSSATNQPEDQLESLLTDARNIASQPLGNVLALQTQGEELDLRLIAESAYRRYEQEGQMDDLETAIGHFNIAVSMISREHPWHSAGLDFLAIAVLARFKRLGQIEDLDEAIGHFRGALVLRPPGNPYRANALNNLAKGLVEQFDETGRMEDLDEAISHNRSVLVLRPPGHPNRASTLNNLAVTLQTRFEQSGRMEDSEEAIGHLHDALALCPIDHPDHREILHNFTSISTTRSSQSGRMEDLDERISHHRSVLSMYPPNHPDRGSALSNLASALYTRFKQLGQTEDLEEGIGYSRDALVLRPPGHSDRLGVLGNLVHFIQARFERLHQATDLEEAVTLLQSGANNAFDAARQRYEYARRWVSLVQRHNHPSTLNAYSTALDLLQLSLALYPDVELRLDALATNSISHSLATSAASYAIKEGQLEKAVEILEQGRALLWSEIRGYRHPVEELARVNPALAEQFKTISSQLETLAIVQQQPAVSSHERRDPVATLEARWTQQRRLSGERDAILEQIRQLDGFANFLRAVPFSTLQLAAKEGPVIMVNIAQERSDVIILQHDNPLVILPLSPGGQDDTVIHEVLTTTKSHDFTVRNITYGLSNLLFRLRTHSYLPNGLFIILDALDKLLVTPILDELSRQGVPKGSRIWWCPTSYLCALPIHATGNLPQIYVSSYTPTLSALINARANRPAVVAPQLLAVIHPGGTDLLDPPSNPLFGVSEELGAIIDAGGSDQVRRLVESAATCAAVLEELPKRPWVHFACHGHLNASKPFRSAFEVEDGALSVSSLLQARLPNAEFAFLAACDSATSGGSSDTQDEVLHLAAAVQFCGFRSVIGTLWPMVDEDGPGVAEAFYKRMFKSKDARGSAEALHRVTETMRKRKGAWRGGDMSIDRWANFIHIGA